MKITIVAEAARGAGKTYILNRLAEEVRRIQAELPGRAIDLQLIESFPYDGENRSKILTEFLGDKKGYDK